MDHKARMRAATWPRPVSTSTEALTSPACMQCTVQCHEMHRVWSQDRFDACPKCTSQCNSDSNIPFFFKYVTVFMESTYYKPAMEVPIDFANAHIADSICHVELEGPNQRLWIIRVKRGPTECSLLQGWKEFAASYELARGDALLFQLMTLSGNSKCLFLVKVFKQSPLLIGNSHANPSSKLYAHKYKRPRVNRSGEHCDLHKVSPAEKRGEDPVVSKSKPSKQGGALEPLDQSKANKECNSEICTPYINLVKSKEEQAITTCTNKGEMNIESSSKREKNGDEDPAVSELKPGRMCVDLKAHTPSEEADTIKTNVFVHSEEDIEIVAFKRSKMGVDCNSDVFSPETDLIKSEEQAEPYYDKGESSTVRLSNKRLKDNVSVHDATNIYVKRKTAVEAMTKITNFYSVKSFKSNITKPDALPFESTHAQMKAGAMNKKLVGCKSIENCGPNDIPQLSFSKMMYPSNVKGCFELKIPKSFANDFKEQTKTRGPFDFTLMVEPTCLKTNDSMPKASGESWPAHCRCSPSGAMVLTRGWREFTCANGLKIGDVCIFRLRKPFTFMIHILPCAQNQHLKSKEDCLLVAAIPPAHLMQSSERDTDKEA